MIGQNTKPSPNLRTEFGRSLSVPSSIVGGSGVGLKGGLGTKVKWKPSMNEDVPSDDSDPEKSPYAVKQRTRVRKRSRLGAAGAAGTSCSLFNLAISGKRKGDGSGGSQSQPDPVSPPLKKILLQAISPSSSSVVSLNNPVGPGPVAMNVDKPESCKLNAENPINIKRKRDMSAGAERMPVNHTSKQPEPVLCPGVIYRSNPDKHVPTHSDLPWTIYSVWFPDWDVVWNCDGSPLTKNEDFKRLLEAIVPNFSRGTDDTRDLYCLRVEVTNLSGENYAIVGNLETSSHSKRMKVEWVIPPDQKEAEKIFQLITTSGDIIVQLRTTAPTGCKGSVTYVHCTPREEKFCNFEELGPGIIKRLTTLHYGCHRRPSVIKFVPNLVLLVNPGQELPVILPTESPVILPTESPVILPTESPVILPTETPIILTTETPIILTTETPVPSASNAVPVQMEEDRLPDDNNIAVPARQSHVQPRRTVNFDIEHFKNNGLFVPGPLRPKLKEIKKNAYEYNTLAELNDLLHHSMAEDQRKGVVVNMIVKDFCNVYGVVDEVLPQRRHQNAHYIRVSDETMESVLVRLHASEQMGSTNVGPNIEVGHIIRVHRVTVQIEWDPDYGDNTMVLSTPAHTNYVLFEKSDEDNQFTFNTCAKTISISDSDKERIGELYSFKQYRPVVRNVVEPEIIHPNIITSDSDRDSAMNVDPPAVASDCDILPVTQDESKSPNENTPSSVEGVCRSELGSPQSSECLFPFEDSPVNDCVLENSNSNSPSVVSHCSIIANQMETTDVEQNRATEIECIRTGGVDKSQAQHFCFRDLKKTGKPFSLWCNIISLCGSSTEGVWYLIIKDVEETLPPVEFRNGQVQKLVPQAPNNYLVLKIINASKFEDSKSFQMLFNDQGTYESYMISNVKVEGDKPPYELEVDGNLCGIERQNYISSQFFEESFDQQCVTKANSVNDLSSIDKQAGENVDADGAAGHTSQEIIEEAFQLPDATAVNLNVADKGSGSPERSSSEKVSQPTTVQPNASHTRTQPKKQISVANLWTGRTRGRRKPREHYQSEDSFQC